MQDFSMYIIFLAQTTRRPDSIYCLRSLRGSSPLHAQACCPRLPNHPIHYKRRGRHPSWIHASPPPLFFLSFSLAFSLFLQWYLEFQQQPTSFLPLFLLTASSICEKTEKSSPVLSLCFIEQPPISLISSLPLFALSLCC